MFARVSGCVRYWLRLPPGPSPGPGIVWDADARQWRSEDRQFWLRGDQWYTADGVHICTDPAVVAAFSAKPTERELTRHEAMVARWCDAGERGRARWFATMASTDAFALALLREHHGSWHAWFASWLPQLDRVDALATAFEKQFREHMGA